MIPSRIGPYRIVRALGEGGMGVVYEGFDEVIESRVAIKVLHPELARDPEVAARFLNEARAGNLIDHPGVLHALSIGQMSDGAPYMVMEFLKGETLAARLRRLGGQLPLGDALRLSRQILAALCAAHDKGIIHRDLKPQNVMVLPDPDPDQPGRERAKILDFGLAKLADRARPKSDQPRTRAFVVMGTPEYMAPEQCRSSRDIDERADLYALGVMLYEMLAGRLPFLGSNIDDLFIKQLNEEPPPLQDQNPQIPQPVAAFVHRLLEKDRKRRPGTAEAVAALDRLAETMSDELSRAAPIAKPAAREEIDVLGATMAPAAVAPIAPVSPKDAVAPLKSPPPTVEENERMARLHLRMKAIKRNLLSLAVDAIVNPSNNDLSGGGGLDATIHRAAGPQLQLECRQLRPCSTGKAKISRGYALSAKHVIHTVGPMWRGGDRGEAELLASCYRECLKLAASHRLKTIAFPAISCGTFLYPLDQAVAIAVRECADFIAANEYPETITFACVDDPMLAAYKTQIKNRARAAYLQGVKKLLRI